MRRNGSILGKENLPTLTSASGIWDLATQHDAKLAGKWPLVPKVTVTKLTRGTSTTDATSYATASVTPTANKVVVIIFGYRDSAAVPTVSGCGLTWTLIDGNTGLYGYWGIAASPSSGAITMTFTGDACTSCAWSVFELDHANTTTPIVQTAKDGKSGSDGSVGLGAFSSVDNATFGGFMHMANESSTEGAGFTEIDDVSVATNSVGLITEWKDTNDTDVGASWSTVANWVGLAFEVAFL